MSVTEIWQHRTSSDVYLVRVAGDGSEFGETDILEACGPVSQDEAEYCHNDAGGHFTDDAETREWIAENADAFRVKFPYVSD